jgi:hypothetical protein
MLRRIRIGSGTHEDAAALHAGHSMRKAYDEVRGHATAIGVKMNVDTA